MKFIPTKCLHANVRHNLLLSSCVQVVEEQKILLKLLEKRRPKKMLPHVDLRRSIRRGWNPSTKTWGLKSQMASE